jgi:hypothetical protein
VKAHVKNLGATRGSSRWPDQQAGYPPLQHRIRLEPDRVSIPRLLELAVKGGFGKGSIATKELRDLAVVVPGNHWQQHTAPVFRTGVIATSEHDPFHVAELIEQEQRVVAAALEVPVVGGSLLIAVRRLRNCPCRGLVS